MSRYAAGTDVEVGRSRGELDKLLAKYGASQRATFSDDDNGRACVQFRLDGRMVRVEVRTPRPEDYHAEWNRKRQRGVERAQWCARKAAQGEREAWRRLLLVVKAKLELVADKISTVEREFLADILLPDGRTLHALLAPQLENAYKTGGMPPLLGPPSPVAPRLKGG